ncbi:CRISPR-associated protein Cas5t [Thermosyntropha lipolytica DSM 11003]|uniref:CRISPR-associated protein Cas5t n=1 Tax=Thermosyntropha lipolytica DSM 11003 TaxID=1123382 RepID=A0A1M5Q3C5_9FIRM|nr:type I-B CRISPR-associated protein Cas5b [Thermosyntropha lipolytica]SHH08482.1 CRISPR-associated protein Cas5t [Thermosyntropha lipolytica DSM 11003]
MKSINVLKIKVFMPNAHFRVIHSGNPRKTYPLPPYSTVIGFFCNILGNKDKINQMLHSTLALGILSRHDYVTSEYIWLRNLNSAQHKKRFVSTDNRIWQEKPEHPGSQTPIKIEVLNDVETLLYIYHSDSSVLNNICANLNTPEKWLSHLHFGRAEDWAMVESMTKIDLKVSNQIADFRKANCYYQWLPAPSAAFGLKHYLNHDKYAELYQKMQGTAVLVTSTYRLIKTPSSKSLIRNFSHIPAKLCSTSIPLLSGFCLPVLFVDPEEGIPVYMATIAKEGGESNGTSSGQEFRYYTG